MAEGALLDDYSRAVMLAAGGFSAADVLLLDAVGWRFAEDGGWATALPPGVSRRAVAAMRRSPASTMCGDVADIQEQLARADTFCISAEQAVYPPLLKEIPDPPGVLMVRGEPRVTVVPGVAIVGSRAATGAAERFARQLGSALGARGVPVISGLARGIDAAALWGAVDAGGPTVAVMGRGFAAVYPRDNERLAQELLAAGAWVTEFPPATAPLPHHFPQRNRVVSGLARAVVVVEAAERSGSLITARFAAEQGRELFAVPGSVWNPRAAGCHRLIREGAAIVLSVDQLVEDLQEAGVASLQGDRNAMGDRDEGIDEGVDERSTSVGAAPRAVPRDGDHALVLGEIDYEPTAPGEIEARLGWPPERVRRALVALEIGGFVQAEFGGYSRCAGAEM